MVAAAIGAASYSPCQSHRGVAVWRDGHLISVGWNDMPNGFHCSGDLACKASCSLFAVHAEQRALLAAAGNTHGAQMLHVKTVNGDLVPSGEPSCPQCSKLLIEAAIETMWLYHATGWQSYNARKFHALTVERCLATGGAKAAHRSGSADACD